MSEIAVLDRTTLVRHGRRLEYFTIVWNTVEGLIAVATGLIAGSISLVGFGIDSFVEVTSGSVLLWRMSVDADARDRERNEKRALKVVGACFLTLSGYIAYESITDLWFKRAPEHSIPGILLACVSLVVMPLLSRAKRRVGNALGSAAMHADAKQTEFCTYLSAMLLAGLLLNMALGMWWADPVAGLIMVPIIAKEGVEGLQGKACQEGLAIPERDKLQMKIESRGAVSFSWSQAKQIADEVYELDVDDVLKERYATLFILASASGLRCAELFALRINDLDFKAGTIRVDESADQRTYIIGPCKNVAAYRTVLLADAEGREALLMLKRFLKGPQTQTSFVFHSKRGTALRETSVLHTFLHPVLRTLGFPQAGMHAFRHGCNRRWELSGMNPAVLRQQMGHSSAVMTARYTGEIPLDKVQEAFSKMELENMEVIGKRPRCTSSRLVMYNQQARGMSGRRTMAV